MRYTPAIFVTSTLFLSFVFAIFDDNFYINILTIRNIIGGSFVITLLFVFQYYFRRRHGEIFGSIDRDIYKIILLFLKESKYSEKEMPAILKSVFKSYSPIQTDKLFVKYIRQNIHLRKICNAVGKTSNEAKLFVFYSLFDLSAKDMIFSIEEEQFVEKIRMWMRVHPKTIDSIKQQYKAKGFKEERKIIEEQNRKKIAESFLPYNAYKTLGVSPTVTKAQLKKVYRTLAKKYHPDKFYGQSEEIIQKAEDKFQEILEAYEVILKYKNFK